ncbi:MAG: ribonuclease P protein subunit [Methanomicrobia archaeon]|nr:ribonuclease P protein subunit [Methanomicrobia archaeon]MCK4309859.1 ribonuclease P protein subunit [Methanomicrobia archaeon]MCK4432371.1 ribonuclease P protein subunit [Methanomicrobia archaeon]MCK4637374.1 ribonuclease P protein subunit [Methanomicrobia archaeon]
MRRELIGKKITVKKSVNRAYIGITGTVIDETRNMLILDTKRKLIKENIVIEVDGTVLDGKDIIGKPENRIKR